MSENSLAKQFSEKKNLKIFADFIEKHFPEFDFKMSLAFVGRVSGCFLDFAEPVLLKFLSKKIVRKYSGDFFGELSHCCSIFFGHRRLPKSIIEKQSRKPILEETKQTVETKQWPRTPKLHNLAPLPQP